jgi:hypothetical protein
MTKKIPLLIVPALLMGLLPVFLRAQAAPPAGSADDVARRDAADLAQFERKAELSKELGATDMLVTEGLPLATWEMDADDPYPMWFVHHAGLLTIFPPKDVQPYVDMKYAAHVQAILVQRCAILAKYGLKGVWNANEPAVMPEAFFTAYPELRGPRIDQANRSRKVYFAPNVDEPETLRMYRDSMQLLLKSCPEVEQFNWVTTDAGSGFDWTPSLYPGINGDTNFRDRPIFDQRAEGRRGCGARHRNQHQPDCGAPVDDSHFFAGCAARHCARTAARFGGAGPGRSRWAAVSGRHVGGNWRRWRGVLPGRGDRGAGD